MGESIRVLAAREPKAGEKSLLGDRVEAVFVDLDADQLRAKLDQLTKVLRSTLATPEAEAGGLALKEVSVGIEITAEGGVALLGTLKAGAKAGLTLTFKRS